GQQTQAGLLACEETLIQSVDFAVVGHWTPSYGRQRHSIYRHTELLCELTYSYVAREYNEYRSIVEQLPLLYLHK
ncbi:MAG: hypothetical protein KDE14_07650, partial [Rhodobacteraceae bacterium]|nr:hypothetical protein [Paracoccaceae bacterium]